MMTDEQRQHAVAAIQQALPALEWTLQPAKIKRLSRDFHWFSPLLTEQLAGKQADAVVRPRDEEELRQLVCACAQHQLPLTLRGSATGNYGQLVPLEGGLLVDMTGLNQIVALGNGTVRAQSRHSPGGHRNRRPPDGLGAALYAIDLSTGEPGRSLRRRVRRHRLHQLWAAGGARQCAQRQSNDRRAGPRVLTVPAPEALLLHHAYGTNGIILEVELALAPAHQWIERLDVFDDFADALNYANACVRSPGLVKRQVALLATPIADYFSHLSDRYRAGQHAVISLIAEESEGLCASLLPRHRGSNAIRQASEEARTRNGSLMEYCWNHTTLHALKVDNTLTYLQTAFDPLRYPQQILQMEQHFAGEVMSHIEFLRDIEGNLTASGLQLVRYTTPERLNAIMQIFRDNDVKINNPHVLQVEDGKQGVIRPDVVAVKQSLDPAGLLNPGKLRGWALRDQLELDSNPLTRATRESPTT